MAQVKVGKGAGIAKALHAGITRVIARISISATTSVGDVLQFAKLPHGAQITDVLLLPGAAFPAQLGLRAGTSLSPEAFHASATFSTIIRKALGSTYKVSVTDEQIPRYDYATITPAVAWTVGHYMDVVLDYVLDDTGL